MQFLVGERFTDETGEWEIASRPATAVGDPSSNSLSPADSGSITELDMPKGRPSRLRPVTAGAIVIPIHFAIVVSLPRR